MESDKTEKIKEEAQIEVKDYNPENVGPGFEYDPNKLFVPERLKPGSKISGTVTRIESGFLRDFLDPIQWEAWHAKEKDLAIKVIVTSERSGSFNKLIRIQPDGMVLPKSSLNSWKKAYGDYPRVGQNVELRANESGFFEFFV